MTGEDLVGSNRNVLEKTVGHALSGGGAHVEAKNVLEGLDWNAVGTQPQGVPHSIFQLLKHMTYWQDWVVNWLDEKNPPIPEQASGSWPGTASPTNSEDWKRAVEQFLNGLDELNRGTKEADLLSKIGKKSRLEMLQSIASHNSYHIGEIVVIRQMLGAWPPPSGGLTW